MITIRFWTIFFLLRVFFNFTLCQFYLTHFTHLVHLVLSLEVAGFETSSD
jgi:hypothetical protein